MAAIADLSDLVNRMTGGASGTPENLWLQKQPRRAGAAPATPIAGRWISLWMYDGQPAAGAAPGAVAVPTNATNGSLKQADPGGGREKWLVGLGLAGLAPGTVMLYDRLLHISGLNGTTTTAQAVGGTLTRYTNGVGNMIAIEIYTQIGATGTTVTAEYTDQGGTASQVTPTIVIGNTGFREAERMLWFPLASGDSGVQAVANVDLLATTGTAGDFGVTVAHPLGYAEIAATGMGPWRSFIDGQGIVEIETGACLALAFLANGTGLIDLMGAVSMVEA